MRQNKNANVLSFSNVEAVVLDLKINASVEMNPGLGGTKLMDVVHPV